MCLFGTREPIDHNDRDDGTTGKTGTIGLIGTIKTTGEPGNCVFSCYLKETMVRLDNHSQSPPIVRVIPVIPSSFPQ